VAPLGNRADHVLQPLDLAESPVAALHLLEDSNQREPAVRTRVAAEFSDAGIGLDGEQR
jgi:hypothetical protein